MKCKTMISNRFCESFGCGKDSYVPYDPARTDTRSRKKTRNALLLLASVNCKRGPNSPPNQNYTLS